MQDRRKNMCKGTEIKVNMAGEGIVRGQANSEWKGQKEGSYK